MRTAQRAGFPCGDFAGATAGNAGGKGAYAVSWAVPQGVGWRHKTNGHAGMANPASYYGRLHRRTATHQSGTSERLYAQGANGAAKTIEGLKASHLSLISPRDGGKFARLILQPQGQAG